MANLFGFGRGPSFRQNSILGGDDPVEQWRSVLDEITSKDFTGDKANAMGFYGEVMVHTCLFPLAWSGAFIQYQYRIDRDLRADFFITRLNRYPEGFAIEVKVLTGNGSHGMKVPPLMDRYEERRVNMGLVIIGNRVSPELWRMIGKRKSIYVEQFNVITLQDWVEKTKAQQG